MDLVPYKTFTLHFVEFLIFLIKAWKDNMLLNSLAINLGSYFHYRLLEWIPYHPYFGFSSFLGKLYNLISYSRYFSFIKLFTPLSSLSDVERGSGMAMCGDDSFFIPRKRKLLGNIRRHLSMQWTSGISEIWNPSQLKLFLPTTWFEFSCMHIDGLSIKFVTFLWGFTLSYYYIYSKREGKRGTLC